MVENYGNSPVSQLRVLRSASFLTKFHYRAALPSSEIAAINDLPITFTMNVAVYISDDDKKRKTLEDLQGLFNSNEIFSAKVTPIDIDAAKIANIKTPAKLEQEILKQHTVKPGDLVIIEWGNQREDIHVSTDRAIFISERVGRFLDSW